MPKSLPVLIRIVFVLKVREQVKRLAQAYCDREAGSAVQPMLDR